MSGTREREFLPRRAPDYRTRAWRVKFATQFDAKKIAAKAAGHFALPVSFPLIQHYIAIMTAEQLTVIFKRFEAPDEVRVLRKGRFELVHLGGMTIGRATYELGWKWSEHVGPAVGATRCEVEHVGLVLSGTATAAFDDGRVFELRAGELFYIPPIPHDSWVLGDQPYVSLHFLGAADYATPGS
jgi:hypothetical protein